ncbi:MAG: tRNA-dihydrouridine synthase family protein [Treponemataceae bacterium]|nr:tRNA-dihydrouridine synthase family protein [Treponemataceae bacterium]
MKLVCAPMAAIGHPAFRMMIERFGGCDEYYTEMIHAPSLLNGGPFERFYTDPAPVPEKIVWQLTGPSPGPMIDAAGMLAARGGIGIDVNMGCCAPEIYSSGAGIAWMSKPAAEVRALVRGIRDVLDGFERNGGGARRLSVKIRLGEEGFTDGGLLSFCDNLVDAGARQIAVHPRTRKEKFREKPRLAYGELLAARYASAGVSVIVNGGIADVPGAAAALRQCPSCAGLMIGRAAVQKPWIFAELAGSPELAAYREPASAPADGAREAEVDLLRLAQDFIADVKVCQPPEFWRTRLQRFFSYYAANMSFAHYLRTKLLNAPDPDAAVGVLSEYFEQVPDDRVLIYPRGRT